jgi:hypothetical protein
MDNPHLPFGRQFHRFVAFVGKRAVVEGAKRMPTLSLSVVKPPDQARGEGEQKRMKQIKLPPADQRPAELLAFKNLSAQVGRFVESSTDD